MLKYEYKNIEPYLQTGPKKNEKQLAWGNIVLFSIFAPLIYLMDLIEQFDKIKIVLAVIFCSIAVIMIVWSICFIIILYRDEVAFTLYQGAISIAYSLFFLGASIKFNYISRHNKLSILYILFCTITFLSILYIIFSSLNKNLKTDYYLKERRINIKVIGVFMVVGGLGIILSRIATNVLSYDANIMGISIVMLFLACIFVIGSHNVYKYYLICKYKPYDKNNK